MLKQARELPVGEGERDDELPTPKRSMKVQAAITGRPHTGTIDALVEILNRCIGQVTVNPTNER